MIEDNRDTGERAVWTGGHRAAHYLEQAKQFQLLAGMETRPNAHARLLELADEYQQLADAKPRKPSSISLGTR
jgi:3-dehydroquinate synthetase